MTKRFDLRYPVCMAVEITACPTDLRPAALNLLEIDAARLDAFQADRPVSWDGLLVARQGTELHGAIWIMVVPVRVASLVAVATAPQAANELSAHLIAAAVEHVQGQVALIQAMLPADEPLPDYWTSCGFEPLAEVKFLACPEHRFPTAAPSGPPEFVTYAPEGSARLAAILTRTYVNTLDCPRLEGKREPHDVLAGYQATGTFDPAHWLLVRHEGQDAGCLLLADRPADNQLELVYMGLAPEFRGRGWARALIAQAQWQARRANRPELALTVDAQNEPALRAYFRAGFRQWQRRQAVVRFFS